MSGRVERTGYFTGLADFFNLQLRAAGGDSPGARGRAVDRWRFFLWCARGICAVIGGCVDRPSDAAVAWRPRISNPYPVSMNRRRPPQSERMRIVERHRAGASRPGAAQRSEVRR
jgi:hypothetical protein